MLIQLSSGLIPEKIKYIAVFTNQEPERSAGFCHLFEKPENKKYVEQIKESYYRLYSPSDDIFVGCSTTEELADYIQTRKRIYGRKNKV